MPTAPENTDDWTLFDLFAYLRGLRAVEIGGEPLLDRAILDWHLACLLPRMTATDRAAAMEILGAASPVRRLQPVRKVPSTLVARIDALRADLTEREVEALAERFESPEHAEATKATAKRVSARIPRGPYGPRRA